MKKKLLCVYIPAAPLSHHLLQSGRSYSTLLSTALLHKIWVLFKTFLSQFQSLWRKLKTEEGISQPSRCIGLVQRQNLESLSTGRTLSSAESPYAPGEGWLWKGKEEQGHYGSVPRSGGGCPIAHLFPPALAGEKPKGERVLLSFPVL